MVLYFTAACPVLCSGNGQYSKGRCLCYSGWKGTECDVPATQCIDPQCGGRGICIMGSCACNSGYKGENCEEGKGANTYPSTCCCWSGFQLARLVLSALRDLDHLYCYQRGKKKSTFHCIVYAGICLLHSASSKII